jgi:uncharacterized protein YifN (PemK superfamily)
MGNRDATNINILDNVIRVTQLSSVKVERGTNNSFLPSLERGNIVSCEYTGIGREYNDTHFAIVWSAPPTDENVVVIPMTSQPKLEDKKTFEIGGIPNFITVKGSLSIKPSWVHLTKMSEVSRKRINPWFQIDTSTGRTITDTNGNNLKVKLTIDQLDRIKEGIKLFYLDEGTCLINYLQRTLNANWICDVSTISTQILLHGYRDTNDFTFNQTDNTTAQIAYNLGATSYTISLRKIDWTKFTSTQHEILYNNKIRYKRNRYDRRENLIWALFSNNSDLVNDSKRLITDII